MSVHDELDAEYDEAIDPDDLDDANRVDGAVRARAVTDYLARELVEDVDAIDVTASESRGEVTLLIHASPQDLGRLGEVHGYRHDLVARLLKVARHVVRRLRSLLRRLDTQYGDGSRQGKQAPNAIGVIDEVGVGRHGKLSSGKAPRFIGALQSGRTAHA